MKYIANMKEFSDNGEDEHFLHHHDPDYKSCTHNTQQWHTFWLHVALFTLYFCLSIFLYASFSSERDRPCLNTLSFNGNLMALQQHQFQASAESPYAGPPSDEVDQAWSSLLSDVNLRASKDELGSLNQTSVRLPQEQGSLVWMDVSHQLHCVKYLRQWVYRGHYHPDVGPEDEGHWLLHIDHCLDLIRQALMCHADTSLMTFSWAPGVREPMLDLTSPARKCVDWEALMREVEPRRVSDAEMAALVNPSLMADD